MVTGSIKYCTICVYFNALLKHCQGDLEKAKDNSVSVVTNIKGFFQFSINQSSGTPVKHITLSLM